MASKLKFLPYQNKWINNPSQFAICEKSRRIGITYAESFRVTRDLASKKVKNNKVWFSSASLSAAEEFIDYVGFWAKYLNTVAEYVGEVIIDKEDDITAHRVVFKKVNAECNVISSNPAGFRGKGGDIILDEFAHHKDQEKLFTAAKPSMMWGNRVRIISTHNADESYFNNLVREIKKGKEGSMDNWSAFKWTIDDAIKDGLIDAILGHKPTKQETEKFLKDIFSGMTQEAIDEEFYCIPRSGADTHLLPYELIIPIERPAEKIIDEKLENITGDLYVGMDIGRKKNFSIIWVVERLGEICYTRKVIPLQKVEYRDQRKILYDVLAHPHFRRCCIDATGIGNEFAENAQKDFGQLRVEPIMFTSKVKEDLASYTYLQVEGKRVVIPADRIIRDDFYSVRAVTTKSGNVRYEAATSELGSHADYFWGFALALEAARSYTGPLIITSGGRRLINTILKGYD